MNDKEWQVMTQQVSLLELDRTMHNSHFLSFSFRIN